MDLETYRELMSSRFAFRDFRPGQSAVLEALRDHDVLAVMPTGSGKSLCYVLPALAAGRTVVVSPLIALMQDQVDSLRARGVPASFINSNLRRAEQNQRYLQFLRGQLDLLYVAPERFANEIFVRGLKRAGVTLFAVDEAHCVSEWGHHFRPDYLTLGHVRQRLGAPRTLALTATAPSRVRRDILNRLGIAHSARSVVHSVDRPNLSFSVVPLAEIQERKLWLVQFLSGRRGHAGIIYARTRAGVEELAADLRGADIPAAAYHAGMSAEDRTRVHSQFHSNAVPVIVATNAFGLGVDKPDIRFIVHFNMPGTIEAYYQEAGRAGRDGDPAECVLLYDDRDADAQEFFIDRAHPDDVTVAALWQRLVESYQRGESRPDRLVGSDLADDGYAISLAAFRASGLIDESGRALTSHDLNAKIDTSIITEHRRYAERRLTQLTRYARGHSCRRAAILRYFGEEPPDRCDNCDNCARDRGRLSSMPIREFRGALRSARNRFRG